MLPDGWDKENADDSEEFGDAGWPEQWAGPEYWLLKNPQPSVDHWRTLRMLMTDYLWMV